MDHPLLQALSPAMLERSTRDGTVLMLLNAGAFHAAICRLSASHGVPLFGSSANLSLPGTKFRVEDIEPEVLGIADVVVDHGLRKWHFYRSPSTLLDIRDCRVVRRGSCYETVADVLARQFAITLPGPETDVAIGLSDQAS